MAQFLSASTKAFTQWQSSVCMIPVALGLLREQWDHGGERHKPQIELSPAKIQAYRELHQHWRKKKNLNPKQQEWIQEMGRYLHVLQQTLFHSHLKNSSAQYGQKKLGGLS